MIRRSRPFCVPTFLPELHQEGWRRKTKVENLITFHQWSRFTLKEHESPVNEGHTVFNMRGGVGGWWSLQCLLI
jgi:hypothetical protein